MPRSAGKTQTALLQVSHVSVAYGRHQAVLDAALQVHAGEIVVILGANGAGKTTLLKAISGMVPCSPGAQITVAGQSMGGASAHALVEAGLALVPEGRGIFGELSVRENLLLGAFAKRAREGEAQRLTEVFALFPRLRERQDQVVRTMSGGEQQMVAIGRAMMSRPQVLMLDEPSLGLSPLLSQEVFKTLREIADSGIGVLLVEQNARMSLSVANRGYLIETGHMSESHDAAAMLRDEKIQETYLGAHPGEHQPVPQKPFASNSGPAMMASALPGPGSHMQDFGGSVGNIPIDELVRVASARSQRTQAMSPANLTSQPNDRASVQLSPAQTAEIDNSIDAVVQSALESTRRRALVNEAAPVANAPRVAGTTKSSSKVEIWRKPTVEIFRRGQSGDLVKE